MSNMNGHSSDSTPSSALSLIPSDQPAPSTALVPKTAYVTEQIHKILFLDAEDSQMKWEFLDTKAPLPVSKLIENKTIVELLLATEPGPRVDYDGLCKNLALLKPYVINTSSGPGLLRFFKSLLQLRVTWLLAAAKVEAFRCYNKTTFTYYIEWNGAFLKDTARRELDDKELMYQKECRDHADILLSGTSVRQEDQLLKELEVKAIKLTNIKASQEMWRNSRILWTITEQYQRYQQMKETVGRQQKLQEEEMKKNKELLQRRVELKKKNEEIRKRQLGMQQQDANNLFMQQDWMTNYLPMS